jgi:signal transduction histidine kinase
VPVTYTICNKTKWADQSASTNSPTFLLQLVGTLVSPLGGQICPYTLRIYPSDTFDATLTSQNPVIITMLAVISFVFTSSTWLLYDVCVERRQRCNEFVASQNAAAMALLNRMVAERTEKLQKANARLEQANHRMTQASAAQLEHFACMRHEIRTPLNCVLGLSSFLLDSELTPAQEESMRMGVSSGDMLLTVVNDVLDWTTPNSSRGI